MHKISENTTTASISEWNRRNRKPPQQQVSQTDQEHLKSVKQIAGCLRKISTKHECLLVTLNCCLHVPTGSCRKQDISNKDIIKGFHPAYPTVRKAQCQCKELPSSSTQSEEGPSMSNWKPLWPSLSWFIHFVSLRINITIYGSTWGINYMLQP
jgi:hypothetical protein